MGVKPTGHVTAKLTKQKELIEKAIGENMHYLGLEWNTMRFVDRKPDWKGEIEDAKERLDQLLMDLEALESAGDDLSVSDPAVPLTPVHTPDGGTES